LYTWLDGCVCPYLAQADGAAASYQARPSAAAAAAARDLLSFTLSRHPQDADFADAQRGEPL